MKNLSKGKLWLFPLPGLHRRDYSHLIHKCYLRLLLNSETPAGCARTLKKITFKDATNLCQQQTLWTILPLRSKVSEFLKYTTFPCKGRQWSSFLSSFQESNWTSASPRKVFLPKRPWCHTENCNILWARRDSGISYCERKREALVD